MGGREGGGGGRGVRGAIGCMRTGRRADRESPVPGVPRGDPVRGMQAARGTPLTGPAVPGQPEPDEPAATSRRTPRRVGILLAVAAAGLAGGIAPQGTPVGTLADRAPIRPRGGFPPRRGAPD